MTTQGPDAPDGPEAHASSEGLKLRARQQPVMAAALAAGALLLGAIADRLRRTGIPTELILAGTLGLSMAAQLALLLGLPVPSHLAWIIIAAAGAATVLSFAILAQYFPKEVSGRANAALGVLHVGAAFALQSLAGLIIAQWPQTDGHYPAEAHEAAMAVGIGLQLVSLGWFLTAPHRRPQTSMTDAVTRMLGLEQAPVLVPAGYKIALSAWTQHVEHTRRQAKAWRLAAAASVVLCVGLAASLSLTWPRPAIALHVMESSSSARADRFADLTNATSSVGGPNLLQPVHLAEAVPLGPELHRAGMHWPGTVAIGALVERIGHALVSLARAFFMDHRYVTTAESIVALWTR
jgi:MFS family permease